MFVRRLTLMFDYLHYDWFINDCCRKTNCFKIEDVACLEATATTTINSAFLPIVEGSPNIGFVGSYLRTM